MKALARSTLLLLIGYALVPALSTNACSRITRFSFDELFAADIIVRATAVEYVVTPDGNNRTRGVPASIIEFKVEETIKGAGVPEKMAIKGYLSDKDDFNELPVPYKFVRGDGRVGDCFAINYKQGAQFLLFLKKTSDGGYTSNISALGPSNEQLKSETDPWLLWVKVRLNPCGKLHEGDLIYEQMQQPEPSDTMREAQALSTKYRVAKCYIQKYDKGDDDQYMKYVKKWVEKYERDEEER